VAIFTVNTGRYDPYKSFRFLVYFGTETEPVAGVSKVSKLNRATEVVEYKEGGYNLVHKGLGRTKYDPITLERGVTQDPKFITWADATQRLDHGHPITSLKDLRREIRIILLNEAGQPVRGYIVHRCWVSEFQALPDLDAGASAIALEHIKLENEGWEVDTTIAEVAET
jgi:phage tail-like protein